VEPGHLERVDCGYVREGVANLFLLCEPVQAIRWIQATHQRTKPDWVHCTEELIDVRYPTVEKIVSVIDNINTHSPGSLDEVFPPAKEERLADRLEIHHTPKHGSWHNVADIELRVLERQCLNRRILVKPMLIRVVVAWQDQRNHVDGRVDWRFTTTEPRTMLKHPYPLIVV
jgi:hypothetical protein